MKVRIVIITVGIPRRPHQKRRRMKGTGSRDQALPGRQDRLPILTVGGITAWGKLQGSRQALYGQPRRLGLTFLNHQVRGVLPSSPRRVGRASMAMGRETQAPLHRE